MERLTNEEISELEIITRDIPNQRYTKHLTLSLIEEIKEYRKISDKLGISLTIYHKLMSKLYCGNGDKLFVKDKNGKIIKVGILEIDYCKKKIHFYKDNNYDADFTYGFYQYGKAFALTKEELGK